METEVFSAQLADEVLSPEPPSIPLERPQGQRQSVWLFPKSEHQLLSANFSLAEFRCRCHAQRCHTTLVHPRLVESLQTLRQLVARPLVITSGYRCITYNRVVGGRPRSFHTRGMAADVVCESLEFLAELTELARGIPAIGAVGQYPARGFLHLDVRPRGTAGQIEQWSG